MGRRRNETDREHMDRIRAARGLPPMTPETDFREELMARTRAARDYCNRANQDEALEFQAFMHIFHPGHALTGTPEGLRVGREMRRPRY